MSVMRELLYVRATFVKKNSCLVARIVSFHTEGVHLHIFHILEAHPSNGPNIR